MNDELSGLLNAFARASVIYSDELRRYGAGHPVVDAARERARPVAIEAWIATNTLAVSNKHEHQCGTCGQYRECYHVGCFYNQLADCDPGTGCRTPKHQFLRIELKPEVAPTSER